MVFGTNTVFGIDAGQNVNGVPSVTVGYRRQEAVVMPLVANTTDNGTFQVPCDVGGAAELTSAGMHPCILVGRRGNSIDTYSVLASFGARFNGSGTGTAGGQLAQYFATGLAAQALAISGGADIVSLDGENDNNASPETTRALQSVFNDQALQESARVSVTARRLVHQRIASYFRGLAAPDYPRKLAEFETALGVQGAGRFTRDYCPQTPQSNCADLMGSDVLLTPFTVERLERALTTVQGATTPPAAEGPGGAGPAAPAGGPGGGGPGAPEQ
jgi:hypothetical protein